VFPNPFKDSNAAEFLGYACFVTGSRPHDVLNWTDTEQEVAAYAGIAFVSSILEAYAEMWD
jgi:hypothetical protein